MSVVLTDAGEPIDEPRANGLITVEADPEDALRHRTFERRREGGRYAFVCRKPRIDAADGGRRGDGARRRQNVRTVARVHRACGASDRRRRARRRRGQRRRRGCA